MPTVRVALTEYDLGPAGWRAFDKLRIQRGRKPEKQALHLILYALDRAMAGDDVELSQERLEALLDDDERLVA